MDKRIGFDVQNNNKVNINFTDDQAKAIDGLITFIGEPFNPAKYIVGLTGAGGTGKTFITNYIITHCKYSNSVIKCTSPTHKACRVFSQEKKKKNVDTIQSTFGLRLDMRLEDFDPSNPQFNPMAKPKLDNIKLLIIDEASMLPAKLVTYICNECKKLNIKILFIGDASQLAPVNERKSIAFERCYEVNNLTQIVRQGASNPITNLLDILRYDLQHKTYKKHSCSWNICDYETVGLTFEEYWKQTLQFWYQFGFENEPYPLKEEEYHKWFKWYKMK